MYKIEDRYCQSCGMPLKIGAEQFLGTNADDSGSDEFCYYCLKNGEYTVDYSMQQMIDVWVKYTGKYNEYADAEYTPEQLRSVLSKRLPTLNRWKQKIETGNIRHGSINVILSYINRHLFEELDIQDLAQKSGMSVYHFRRVFREITGENAGSYIQRLRLEYAAYQIISSGEPIKNIIDKSSYENKHSFSKAFRKHFGLSPLEYRKRNKITIPESTEYKTLSPRITKINGLDFICLGVGDTYKNSKDYDKLWKDLISYAEKENAGKNIKYSSISLDDPVITNRENCRFYIGIESDNQLKPPGKFLTIEIPNGLYAVFTNKGSYSQLHKLYEDIYLYWLPQNGYRQVNPVTFEIYHNSPRKRSVDELLTEVYVPIEKIKK